MSSRIELQEVGKGAYAVSKLVAHYEIGRLPRVHALCVFGPGDRTNALTAFATPCAFRVADDEGETKSFGGWYIQSRSSFVNPSNGVDVLVCLGLIPAQEMPLAPYVADAQTLPEALKGGLGGVLTIDTTAIDGSQTAKAPIVSHNETFDQFVQSALREGEFMGAPAYGPAGGEPSFEFRTWTSLQKAPSGALGRLLVSTRIEGPKSVRPFFAFDPAVQAFGAQTVPSSNIVSLKRYPASGGSSALEEENWEFNWFLKDGLSSFGAAWPGYMEESDQSIVGAMMWVYDEQGAAAARRMAGHVAAATGFPLTLVEKGVSERSAGVSIALTVRGGNGRQNLSYSALEELWSQFQPWRCTERFVSSLGLGNASLAPAAAPGQQTLPATVVAGDPKQARTQTVRVKMDFSPNPVTLWLLSPSHWSQRQGSPDQVSCFWLEPGTRVLVSVLCNRFACVAGTLPAPASRALPKALQADPAADWSKIDLPGELKAEPAGYDNGFIVDKGFLVQAAQRGIQLRSEKDPIMLKACGEGKSGQLLIYSSGEIHVVSGQSIEFNAPKVHFSADEFVVEAKKRAYLGAGEAIEQKAPHIKDDNVSGKGEQPVWGSSGATGSNGTTVAKGAAPISTQPQAGAGGTHASTDNKENRNG